MGFDRLKEKFRQFMTGRYGTDQLNRFLLAATLVLLVLSMFFRRNFLLNFLVMALLVICYVRMLSRNYRKRYDENVKYMTYRDKFLSFFRREKSYMEQRKTHHIYKCPTCKQKIRVPKGKGKICVTCPKCKTEFIKYS